MTAKNCGIVDHPDTCLCDVQVDNPVQLTTSLQDNWLLSMVADYMGICRPWNGDKLGAIMEASAEFLDVYYRRTEQERSNFLVVKERDSSDSFPMYWKQIKSIVEHNYKLYNTPPSWKELLDNSNCTLETFVTALTYNKGNVSDWSYQRLDELQEDILHSGLGRKGIRDKYGLNKDGSGKWIRDLIKSGVIK